MEYHDECLKAMEKVLKDAPDNHKRICYLLVIKRLEKWIADYEEQVSKFFTEEPRGADLPEWERIQGITEE